MHALTFSLLLLLPATALGSFNVLNLPEEDRPNISEGTGNNPACIAALNATIDCEPSILANTLENPTVAELDKLCTSQCLKSLRRWARGTEGCAGDEFLNYSGLREDAAKEFGDEAVSSATNMQQFIITAAYHSKCLRDLSNGAYCVRTHETDNISFNSSDPDPLCKEDTCGTQFAYLYAPVKVILDVRNTNRNTKKEDIPVVSLEVACPGIDTSGYPLREEDVAADTLKSDDKPNAAAAMGVSVANVVAAVAGGILLFLAL
ncbi:hypothetical protein TWF718_005756 [Orbilia javanica]|uniref:Uncharacterized protein n=1 Tax=Orbilia javanica TaxID=47235 RepID=A0AAN8REF3_9PEZI